jgi:CheY-like chemotaxis protein
MSTDLYHLSEDKLSSLFLNSLPVERVPPQVKDRVLQRILTTIKELATLSRPDQATILIVDHQELFRRYLIGALQDVGYKVLGAATGQEALQLCATQTIHITLLDSQLMDMDVYDLCMTFSQEHGVPVIIMAGQNHADEMLQGFAAGASAYVYKPFPLRELSAQIRQTLTNSQ